MMMRALEAGGMPAVYDQKLAAKGPGTHDYELPKPVYRKLEFIRDYDAKLVKVLSFGIPLLPVGQYKIVFMLRDPASVLASATERFRRRPGWSEAWYRQFTEGRIAIAEIRPDMDVTVLHYEKVLVAPTEAFQRLVDDGWPINVPRASAIIDPSKCHFGSPMECPATHLAGRGG